MTETPEQVRARQTATALNILPAVFENPIWSPSTCLVCKGPLEGSGQPCWVCAQAAGAWTNLADTVTVLTYAGPRSPQAKQDLRQYKDGSTGETRDAARYRLSYLVWYFAAYHAQCMVRRHGPPDLVAIVPSGRVGRRPGQHPLETLDYFSRDINRVAITRLRDAIPRRIDPDSIRIDSDVSGKVVLLFDDTWTTGASLQSVAVALNRAGATTVNAVVIGRWLNAGWQPTDSLMASTPALSWDPAVCPVTGGPCP